MAASERKAGARLGVTGHQDLPAPIWVWVRSQIRSFVQGFVRPVGVSSLARGADQEFADEILEQGGTLEAVLPFLDYERVLTDTDLVRFRSLLRRATVVHQIPPEANDELAYLHAGRRVIELSEVVVAVWDGKPAKGLGGTGDAVGVAMRLSRPVFQINPVNQTAAMVVQP